MQSKTIAMMAVLLLALAIYVGLRGEPSRTSLASLEANQHFTRQVLPLLEAKCVACHGADPKEIQIGLDLTSLQGLLRGGDSGKDAVVPGRPDASLLIQADLAMPPKANDRLSEAQIAVFEKWIADGTP